MATDKTIKYIENIHLFYIKNEIERHEIYQNPTLINKIKKIASSLIRGPGGLATYNKLSKYEPHTLVTFLSFIHNSVDWHQLGLLGIPLNKIYLASLPLGLVNATTSRSPYNTFVVFINEGIFLFSYYLSISFSSSIDKYSRYLYKKIVLILNT